MPSSLIGAVVGAGVAELVGGALVGTAITGLTATLLSKGAGAIASVVVGQILSGGTDDGAAPASSGFAGAGGETRRTVSVQQPISPWLSVYGRTRVGGVRTFAEASADNSVIHQVFTFTRHVCESIDEVWFNDERVTLDADGYATGKYAGYVRIVTHTGETGGQPFPMLVAESAGKWTDAHRQHQCAKIYVRIRPVQDVFPGGLPNITAVIKGRRVYDPRTGNSAWSDNWALCLADYLCDPDGSLRASYTTDIDLTLLSAAANVSDEAVTLAGGGTEKRYTVNGVVSSATKPGEVIGVLLAAGSGRCVCIGGQWRISAGAYATPSVTLSETDFRGAVRVQTRLSRRDNCNAVRGVFASPDNFWQPSDFPAVTSATYEAQDNDERVWQDIRLPYTDSASMAQRIARIVLERTRRPVTVVAPLKLSAYRVLPGDTVQLTMAKFGFSAKTFEVVESTLAVDRDDRGAPILGVDLTLREIDANAFAWTTADEGPFTPAPSTNLPNPFAAAAPGNPVITEALYETRTGRGVAAKMIATWGAADDAFVLEYQPEYRVAGTATWTVLPRTDATSVEVLDAAPGRYDWRVKGINRLGVASDYATTLAQEIVGLSAAPAAVTGLTIQKVGSWALITFTQAAELDVQRGGRILVRHSEATSGATWEGAFSIGQAEGYPGDAVMVLVPLKAGTYLLKARDSGGRESTAATVASDGATALAFAALANVTEDAAFTGTHSGTVSSGGVLKLAAAGLVDSIPNWDDVSDIDSYGGILASGTYTFSAGLDLGSVKRVQLYSTIAGLTDNVNDRVDERTGNVDDWLDFDGTTGGSATDAWVEVRSTPDNPAGAPTWSDWQRLDRSEYFARGFQFRAQLRSNDPAYNVLVTTLRGYVQNL